MNIRPARATEAEELSNLASRAKARWGYSAAQLEIWRPELGIGSALLGDAAARAAATGAHVLAIDADPNAESFYLANGARRVGEIAAPIEGHPDRVRPQMLLDLDP